MKFIELPLFTQLITGLVDDMSYAEFQKKLVLQPDKGDVMQIEFDAEILNGSVKALSAHVRGKRKLTLHTHSRGVITSFRFEMT